MKDFFGNTLYAILAVAAIVGGFFLFCKFIEALANL